MTHGGLKKDIPSSGKKGYYSYYYDSADINVNSNLGRLVNFMTAKKGPLDFCNNNNWTAKNLQYSWHFGTLLVEHPFPVLFRITV